MATDYTPGSIPERLPDGHVTVKPKHLGSNVAVGHCPACDRGTSWSHCGSKGCRWLFCMTCRVSWSERTGRWFAIVEGRYISGGRDGVD